MEWAKKSQQLLEFGVPMTKMSVHYWSVCEATLCGNIFLFVMEN